TAEDWQAEKNLILNRLKTRCFRGWPAAGEDLRVTLDFREEKDGMILSRWSFDSQAGVRLPLYLVQPATATLADLDLMVLNALGEEDWTGFLEIFGAGFSAAFPGVTLPEHDAGAYEAEKKLHASQKWGMLYLPVRGTGPTAWTTDEKE